MFLSSDDKLCQINVNNIQAIFRFLQGKTTSLRPTVHSQRLWFLSKHLFLQIVENCDREIGCSWIQLWENHWKNTLLQFSLRDWIDLYTALAASKQVWTPVLISILFFSSPKSKIVHAQQSNESKLNFIISMVYRSSRSDILLATRISYLQHYTGYNITVRFGAQPV